MYQDREQYLRKHIGSIGEEAFPDDVDIEWRILGFDHKKSLSYVEVEPVPNTAGYDRFKFAISFAQAGAPVAMAVHALEDGKYFLLSSTEDYTPPPPKKASKQPEKRVSASSEPTIATTVSSKTGIWFEGIFATLSTATMALILLTTWISPLSIDNGRWLGLAPAIIGVEFIMIHSGVFMAVLPAINMKGRWWLYAAMMVFYTLFVWAVSRQFDNWYFLGLYSAVILSRWLGAILGDNNLNESLVRSGAAMFFLIVVVFVMYAIPLPYFGITDEVYRQNSGWSQDGSLDQSVYWLAAGTTYFLLLAMFEWMRMKYKLRMAGQGPSAADKISMPQPARVG